jgi:peptidoglycan/xylan/chitin deacetylase (PgdA/CDA1 family)
VVLAVSNAPAQATPGSVPPAAVVAEPDAPPWTPPPPIIRRVDNDDMRIALTFDACATQSQGYGFDRAVYGILQREQVPATIFVSGRWVEFHPDAMEELVANPLVEFANHSYAHRHMPHLSPGEIGAEIDRTEAALGRYGQRSVAFRPPFGSFSERVLDVVRSRRLPAVLWDVVSGDPGTKATAASITRAVLGKTRSGSIIVFHINARAPQTATALPAILRELRARGFEFVHISKLLASGAGGNTIVPVPSEPARLSPTPTVTPGPARHTIEDGDETIPPSLLSPTPEEPHGPGALVPASVGSAVAGRR